MTLIEAFWIPALEWGRGWDDYWSVICYRKYPYYLALNLIADAGNLTGPVTQAEIETVIQNAKKQGIDLTQITIFYGGTDSTPSQRGFFSLDGTPLAADGTPLTNDQITGFYCLGAD